jgi:succinoglycan biosynthesis transport protein ExoP
MADEIYINHEKAETDRVPAVYNQRLPSTDLRGAIPGREDDEEIQLRDYLDVIIRRKWVIICIMALSFITTLVFTLSSTKLYKATATILVSQETPQVTKFEEVVGAEVKAREFYETQVELLLSQSLIERVINKLNLMTDPIVGEIVFGDGKPGMMQKIKESIKSFLPTDKELADQNLPTEETLKRQSLYGYFNKNLEAKPGRNSMLITVSFSSPSRKLSQEFVNTLAKEFIAWKMDQKLEASQIARDFLMMQIDRAKINLEKTEEELNLFAKQAGIVSLDARMNSIYRQLEELNSSLAIAEADLIAKRAAHSQAVKDGPSNLPKVLDSPVIGSLKKQYAELQAEYEDLTTTFHKGYPKVKNLRARMRTVADRIKREEERVFQSIKNEYETALMKTEAMKARVDKQKQLALELNERATQYKIMAREVETNKAIYQSLLERAKEIESMVGVSSSNIHIIDLASLPLIPFSPRVKLNLLLAIVVGFLAGLGFAFVVEYFADTITNPDQISDRFQIPILGVVPLAKSNGHPTEKTFIYDPRAPLSEAIRTSKVSIQLSGADTKSKSFLITSTIHSEGKTTLAVNLAMSFAVAGEKVVLIDTDLRKPRIHKVFDIPSGGNGHGLSSFLAGLTDRMQLCSSDLENLKIIPSGPIPPNPVELLASKRFKKLLNQLGDKHDRIILDGPPHHGFADILVLSQHVGGIVLITSISETNREALRHFKKGIDNVNGIILGCIVNKVKSAKRHGYHYYYKYYSSYEYEPSDSSLPGTIQWSGNQKDHDMIDL